MAFGPLENFRNFLSSRPPLVLFVVCIGMIAIAFISYAYYIKYNDVYNPDVQEVGIIFNKTRFERYRTVIHVLETGKICKKCHWTKHVYQVEQ